MKQRIKTLIKTKFLARRKKGRALNAVLILNKSKGMTSNGALQRARRLCFAQKAGHTGSLDPMATGVLPICFGEATKFSQWGLDADKKYIARVRLGVTTRTGDAEGEVIGTMDASHIKAADVESVLDRFRGEIQQVPSMFSALKYKGTPLYELARKGVEVEREPRTITIFSLQMSNFEAVEYVEFDISVHSSKGTYIRTLAEDIGIALGVGAHLTALHRTAAGCFSIEQAKSLEELEEFRGEKEAESLDPFMLSADATIKHLQKIDLEPRSAHFFLQGQAVMVPEVYRFAEETDIVRVFSDSGEFLGVGEVTDESTVKPKRVIASE